MPTYMSPTTYSQNITVVYMKNLLHLFVTKITKLDKMYQTVRSICVTIKIHTKVKIKDELNQKQIQKLSLIIPRTLNR